MKVQRLAALGLIVGTAVGVTLLADRLGGITGVDQLRYKTLDWRQNATAESFVPGVGTEESPITLVLFDELAVTDPDAGWVWEQPFPRAHIADVIDAVAAAGARTIGLDVHLELMYPRLNAIDGGDDRLLEAIERAGNVILVGPVVQTPDGPRVRRPHPAFDSVAAGFGAADLPTAFETVREASLAVRSGQDLVPSFSLAAYAHARGTDADSLLRAARSADRIELPGLPSALGRVPDSWWSGDAAASNYIVPFTLHYYGPPSSSDGFDPPGTFPAVSSGTVDIAAMLQPDLFEDRIVLIGSGFHDSDKFRTPFFGQPAPPAEEGGPERSYEWMYGVEIHANALQTMLDQEYVRPLGVPATVFVLLLAAAGAGGVTFWKGAWWGGGATLLLVAALVVTGFWTWGGAAYGPGGNLVQLGRPFLWFPVVTPSLAAFLSFVGSVAYVSVVEGREKRFIKGAFGKYVSPEVVAEIAEHPESLQLGGQKRPLSILFSDLAGFTNLSERMDPQDLLAHLNDYLSDMTQIVMDEGGTLDKYIGDAVMAFWNAPRALDDHADRALRAAVLMQRRMHDLNAKWRAADSAAESLTVRIGINTGTVVVGNVGGKERFDYSAIGDAVNLAARLEPANKSYDTLTMASEHTMAEVDRSAFRYRELDLIAVKGKEDPVTVYEILEMAGVEFSEAREEALRHYDAGLVAYKNRDWTLAAGYFAAALEADPDDGPSAVYLARAREWEADPPPVDWDFVVRRTSK